MKSIKVDKKIDYRLVIIAVALMAVIIVADIVLNLPKSNYEQVDLPDNYNKVTSKLVLNEIMSNNAGVYVNHKSAITDYIELYNGTDEDINLKGYGLSDTDEKIKFVFDDVVIKANSYYIVSLSGNNESGCAGFKLSSKGGEKVILTNPAAKIIDSVETVFLGKNEVMIRTGAELWSISSLATPGFENSLAGKEAYGESLLSEEESALLVNEILVNNKGNYVNENGRMDGFVELKNISEEPVKLSEYTISNSINIPFRYQFEDVVLNPGELYTVYCGDGDYLHQDYLGFGFSNKEGTVILSHNGKIIQKLDYINVANGQSYCFDGYDYYSTVAISPNEENTPEGVNNFQSKNTQYKNDLLINEVMNNNGRYLAQNGANYYDWIELYNNSNRTLKLSDYYLSLSNNDYYQYQLPEVELEAGGYFLLMCSGDSSLTSDKYTHADFKLGNYEGLFLSTKEGLVDCMCVGDVPSNYSIGKGEGYGIYFMDKPTPKAKNETGKMTIAREVTFSVPAGIFNGIKSLQVELSAEGTIRYTLDGSEPTSKSAVYSKPLSLTKTTVVKAKCFVDDSFASETFVQSYIINENHTMDVVSVSLNPSDFSYINSHYSVSYTSSATNATRFGTIELLSTKEDGFNAKCSISVGGGFGKTLSKKSYSIKFNKAAGQTKLNYPVFSNRDCASYDSLFLRSASTDYTDSLIKDIFATSLVDEYTDLDVQAYRPVILYVNGQYWGIYTIREKINEHFIEDHYNVDSDGLNIVESNGYAKYGSYADYKALRDYVKTHNLAVQEYYDYVASKLDVKAFADYWACELYTNNYDLGNVRYFSSPYINDGKYMPIFYDIDHGFHNYITGYEKREEQAAAPDDGIAAQALDDEQPETGDAGGEEDGEKPAEPAKPTYVEVRYDMWNIDFYSQYLLNSRGMGLYRQENDLLVALFKNSQFKQLWFQRLAYHLGNTFSRANALNKINQLYNIYKPEIARDARRWGYTVSHWELYISTLKSWARERPARVVNMTRYHFGLSSSETKKYFNGLY